MKQIITVPNKTLTTLAKKVNKIDQKIKKLISEMKQTLNSADDPKGVGLAAPQVGISLQIFLIKPEEESPIRVFINPKIINKSREMLKGIPGEDGHLEGCLSIPQVWGVVKRHKSITIEYLDENGKSCQQTFTDFEAIIIQHEIDHLNGVLFSKKVVEQKGKLYEPVVNDKGEEVLEEINL